MPVKISDALRSPSESWNQGDVVRSIFFYSEDEELPAILLTPACDVAQDKVDNWTFVALFPERAVVTQFSEALMADWGPRRTADGKAILTQKQKSSIQNRIRELVGQRMPRFHWLPVGIDGSESHVADFTCVTSLSAEEARVNLVRICSLNSSWREQIAARYAAYMGRVGTEDFDAAELDSHIERMAAFVVAPD